jgi:hypothetical protein
MAFPDAAECGGGGPGEVGDDIRRRVVRAAGEEAVEVHDVIATGDEHGFECAVGPSLWQPDARAQGVAETLPTHGVLEHAAFSEILVDRLCGASVHEAPIRSTHQLPQGAEIAHALSRLR